MATDDQTGLFDFAPWTTGVPAAPAQNVPLVLPVAIAGHQYLVDLSELRMTTMQVRRVALDDSVEPGEQSLNAAGVWPRAQDNWFLGAGQMFLDNRFAFETIYTHTGENPSVRTRFWRSKGLYVNQEGQLTLLPLQVNKRQFNHSSHNASALPQQIIACGTYLYVSEGAHLYWTDDPTPNAPVWQEVGINPTPTNITSLTTDGSRVWFAMGAAGIGVTNQGTLTSAAAATPAPLGNVTGVVASAANSGPIAPNLTAGMTYIYAITAVDSFGNETYYGGSVGKTTNSPAQVSLTQATPATPVTLGWDPNPLCVTFNVYRREWTSHHWQFLGSVESANPTWLDKGSPPYGYNQPTSSNATGSSAYAATFVSYCSGYLIASTGRDLVNILSSQNAQFIYEHPSPNFIWSFAFSTPTAIHVGGAAGGLSFIGAIQPDSATEGANLAPPYQATSLPPGEVPYAISYNAGSIVLGTSAGVRTGTTPDSTGVFDINPVINDPGPCQCLAAWQNYCYFGWSNYNTAFDQPGVPDPSVFSNQLITSGLGKLDLSQYTTLGVPAYASDAMTPDVYSPTNNIVTGVAVINGLVYFAAQGLGIFGASPTAYAPQGWMEVGWTRYSTQEPKILTRANLTMQPLPSGCSVELDVYDQYGNKTVAGINGVAGSTGPYTYYELNAQVGTRFMPTVWLYGDDTITVTDDYGKVLIGSFGTPILNEWILYGIVIPVRQDEWMIPLIMRTRYDDLTAGGGQPHWQDTFYEYTFLKSLEASGIPVNVTVGGLQSQCYIDQIQLNPEKWGEWNDARTLPESTLMVKLITLGPIGSGPSESTPPGGLV